MRDLLTEIEAAKLIGPKGVNRSTLRRLRQAGKIPFLRIARVVYYRRSDIDLYVESCCVTPRSWVA